MASYRRSSGERRQQLKWLLAGAGTGLVTLPLALSLNGSHGLPAFVGKPSWVLGLLALPVSMGVAIFKYRLYDIDRIVSRTLAYTIVTGLLVGVYAGWYCWPPGRCLYRSTPVAVACATLVAAALFYPLRRRVQRVVDRWFNRAATMPTRPWPRSRPGCRTRWTWIPCKATWPVSCTKRWNPPTYRCGSANAAETGFRQLRRQRQARLSYGSCRAL